MPDIDAAPNLLSTVVSGKYFWQLVFSYDNSGNSGTYTETYKYSKKLTANFKQFASSKFNFSVGYTYKNQASASLKYQGVSGNASVDYTYHTDLAEELVRSCESAQAVDEETSLEVTWNVGANSKATMYRLYYVSDSVSAESDIFASTPQDDVFVNLNFALSRSILGLNDILNQFAHTFPQLSNIAEWQRIRDTIIQYSDTDQETAFNHFVQVLGSTSPLHDNIAEWASIRSTCGQILASWGTTDKQPLFSKLLLRFTTIFPLRDNMAEWKAIRDLSTQILGSVMQSF